MRPTSIIFIILAVILIVAGIVVGLVGGSMAKAADIQLLSETVDDEGNAITTHNLNEYSVTDFTIDIRNADVNIIGQSVESKIEFKNMNSVTYDFAINEEKLELKSVNPLNVINVFKYRENGSAFNGLRHYIFLGKYRNVDSQVNIYVSPDQSLSDLKINVKNGNITVKNMITDCRYELNAERGYIDFNSNTTSKEFVASTKDGSVRYSMSKVHSVDFSIENGNAEFKVDSRYNYSVKCTPGKVYINEENLGDVYTGVYPEMAVDMPEDTEETEENEESEEETETPVAPDSGIPTVASVKIVSGDCKITTA